MVVESIDFSLNFWLLNMIWFPILLRGIEINNIYFILDSIKVWPWAATNMRLRDYFSFSFASDNFSSLSFFRMDVSAQIVKINAKMLTEWTFHQKH